MIIKQGASWKGWMFKGVEHLLVWWTSETETWLLFTTALRQLTWSIIKKLFYKTRIIVKHFELPYTYVVLIRFIVNPFNHQGTFTGNHFKLGLTTISVGWHVLASWPTDRIWTERLGLDIMTFVWLFGTLLTPSPTSLTIQIVKGKNFN